ncbi:MAG: class I SAM-dependent methyltransferase [Candidatus Altiarchaeota archaeon]|nr:class I SAM-dependent methyltransferase [Candidatus Altiarchaeota archaeon]
MAIKAEMFNEKAASSKSRPDEILKILKLEPGQKIADIGSGGGYFALRFAEAVGERGRVYAADTNPEFLEFVKSLAQERSLGNIETILVTGGLSLPEGSLDLIFMRNLYHHLSDRITYFRRLRDFLRPSGRVAVIEYEPHTGNFFSFRRLFGHSTPREVIIGVLKGAGYKLVQDYDILPEQHFLVFWPSD